MNKDYKPEEHAVCNKCADLPAKELATRDCRQCTKCGDECVSGSNMYTLEQRVEELQKLIVKHKENK